MKTIMALFCTLIFFACFSDKSKPSYKLKIIEIVGQDEYDRLMALDLDGFDQSAEGFRLHSDDYNLTSMLIPEYINVRQLTEKAAANLHWHMGQIHAINDNYSQAVSEMKLSMFEDSPVFWKCYVLGSIAFLERDLDSLNEQYELLSRQDETMNIEVLGRLIDGFEKTYWEAYNGM